MLACKLSILACIKKANTEVFFKRGHMHLRACHLPCQDSPEAIRISPLEQQLAARHCAKRTRHLLPAVVEEPVAAAVQGVDVALYLTSSHQMEARHTKDCQVCTASAAFIKFAGDENSNANALHASWPT